MHNEVTPRHSPELGTNYIPNPRYFDLSHDNQGGIDSSINKVPRTLSWDNIKSLEEDMKPKPYFGQPFASAPQHMRTLSLGALDRPRFAMRRFSENALDEDSAASFEVPPRHHFRRQSVAIKFRPNDMQLREMEVIDSSTANGLSRSDSQIDMKRKERDEEATNGFEKDTKYPRIQEAWQEINKPPSPIAEAILKGDVVF